MARRSVVEILLTAKDATAAGFRGVLGRLRGLREQIFSLRTAMAAFTAFVAGTVVKNIVGAFAAQEDAVIRLNTALRVTGRYSDEASIKIQAMAVQMQKLTTVADEAALAVSATVAQLATDLTADQLAEVQKAAIGLAQTFGMDLESAAVLVGKALAGERDILSRYGISLDTTAGQQQRFNELMKKTAGFFEVAAGSAASLRGQWMQAANQLGELKETIGEIIVRVFDLDKVGTSLRDRIEEWNGKLRANMGTWVHWGKVVVAVVTAVGKSIWGLFKIVRDFGELTGAALAMGLLAPFHLVETAVRTLASLWNRMAEAMNKNALARGLIGAPQFGTFDLGNLSKIGEAVAGLENTISTNSDEIKDSFTAIVDAWKGVQTALNAPVDTTPPRPILTGGGANTGKPRDFNKEAKELTTRATVLAQKFQLGLVPLEKFKEALGELVPKMIELRNSGQVADEELIALAKSLQDLININNEASLQPSFLDHWIGAMEELQNMIDEWDKHLATTTVDSLRSFAVNAAAAFAAVGQGGREGAVAFQQAMLGAIAAVAASFSELFAARAAAEIAAGIAAWPLGNHHFVAAAQYFAAAAAMSALGGMFTAAAARSSVSSGGAAREREEDRTKDASDNRGEKIIEVVGDPYLDMSNPRIRDAVEDMFNEAEGMRIILRYRPGG